MTDPSGRSTHQPGAVPLGLASIVADGMRQACLTLISGNGHAAPRPQAAQPGERRLVHDDGLAAQRRHRLAGEVVGRRTETAGGHDDRRAREGRPERLDHDGLVVGQVGHAQDGHAVGHERASELTAVRVQRSRPP